MRTLTAQDSATLQAPYGYAVHTRAFVATYVNPVPLVPIAGSVRSFLFDTPVTVAPTDTTSTVVLSPVVTELPPGDALLPVDVPMQTGNGHKLLNDFPGIRKQGYFGNSPGGDAATFTGAAMTFEAIFRFDRDPPANTVNFFAYCSTGAIIAGGAAADNCVFSLGLNTSRRLVYQSQSGAGVTTVRTQAVGPQLTNGTTFYVAVVRNGTSVTFYLQGFALDTFAGVTAPTGGTNGRWRFAAFNTGAEDSAWLSVDCVRLSSVARSAADILATHNAAFANTAVPVWANLTTWQGVDWLDGVTIDSQVNQPSDSCTVTLQRDNGTFSMNPLKSYAGAPGNDPPTLQVGHEFYVETATMPLGAAPQSTDWREMFRGDIDTVDASQEPMTFTGRDLSGRLADRIIESEKEYGATAGVAVETVIQQILSDNGTGVVLFMPGPSPGWMLRPYVQKREPVLTAIRNLAQQIGYEVRYRFDSVSNTFRLTLYLPERTTTTPVWTFTDARLRDVSSLVVDRNQVRNFIEVTFSNRTVLDTKGQPTRQSAKALDSSSINKYGRRYMAIAEASSSNIDTPVEAQALADAALADLREPLADQQVTTDYFFPAALGDLFRFNAGALYAANQDLAVVGLNHSLSRDECRTQFNVRGQPLGGQADWLARDARPGLAAPPPTVGPQPITGLTATPVINGASIAWVPAVFGAVDDDFEVHVSTTNGFTPDATSLKVISRTTRAEVSGLTAGVTYYCRVIPRDKHGNRGADLGPPAQVSFVAGAVSTAGGITSGQDYFSNVYSTAGQSLATGVLVDINFNATTSGTPWTADGASSYFPVLTAGRYTVTAFMLINGYVPGNPSTQMYLLIYSSGATLVDSWLIGAQNHTAAAASVYVGGTITVQLSATHRIKIGLFQTTGGARTVAVGGADDINFCTVVRERG